MFPTHILLPGEYTCDVFIGTMNNLIIIIIIIKIIVVITTCVIIIIIIINNNNNNTHIAAISPLPLTTHPR